MRTSLKQVATLAGVSEATVSRVLNKVDVRIAQNTRERIQAAAKELGYEPNRAAQALATGRTNAIAIWSANIKSPFYTQVINALRDNCEYDKFAVMVSAVDAVSGKLDTRKLLSWPVDAVIAVGVENAEVDGLEGPLLFGKPFVRLGDQAYDGCDYVRVNFQEAAREAVLHLSEVGCKRVAYLLPDRFDLAGDTDSRLAGFQAGTSDAGLTPEYIPIAGDTRRDVSESLKSYVEQHGVPDGIFCYNDDLAIGAYRTLRDLGLRIPEDVAIIGCDGIEDTEYLDAPISTIIQPSETMCCTAWDIANRRINDPEMPLQQITLVPHLTIRRSSLRGDQELRRQHAQG